MWFLVAFKGRPHVAGLLSALASWCRKMKPDMQCFCSSLSHRVECRHFGDGGRICHYTKFERNRMLPVTGVSRLSLLCVIVYTRSLYVGATTEHLADVEATNIRIA